MPPLDRIGSAMNAARLPVDCWSTSEQLDAVQAGRQGGQARCQFDHRAGQHAAEEVRDRAHLSLDRGHDVRMSMAEQGAHLA